MTVSSSHSATVVEKILRDPEGTTASGSWLTKRTFKNYKPKLKFTPEPIFVNLEERSAEREVTSPINMTVTNVEIGSADNVGQRMDSLGNEVTPTLPEVACYENLEFASTFRKKKESRELIPMIEGRSGFRLIFEDKFWFPTLHVPSIGSIMIGKIMKVFSFSDGCQFTLFDTGNALQLRDIEEEMRNSYGGDEANDYKRRGRLNPGCYGVFIPEWDKWVRCQLKMLMRPGREEFIVKLLDYGRTMVVSRKNVRSLTKEWHALPQQSYVANLRVSGHDTAMSFQNHAENEAISFHVEDANSDGPAGFVTLSLALTEESETKLRLSGGNAHFDL